MHQPLKPVTPSSESTEGIVAAAAYLGGQRVAEIRVEDAGERSRRPGHVVWIGLHEPSLNLLRQLQAHFDLHEVAIEDTLKGHQLSLKLSRPSRSIRAGTIACFSLNLRMAPSHDGRG